MAYEPPFTLTSQIARQSADVAELVGRISPSSSLSRSPELHRRLRISTIHSSLAIEQNELTEEQVSAVFDGKKVIGPERDVREAANARRAYDLLDELNPLSVDDLLKVHGVMMEQLAPDAGRLRTKQVGVYDGDRLIHAGTPAAYVPEVLGDLFSWLARTELHPLVASSVFHFEFEFIHPFSDGNGRTGRLWQTLILSKWRPVMAWVPVESMIRARQSEYYAALAQVDEQGGCGPFVSLMLELIEQAIRPYVEDAPDELEARALAWFAAHPKGTVAELAVHLAMSKRSCERLVASLRASNRLAREGSARSGTWTVRP